MPLQRAAAQQDLRFAFYGRVSTEDNQDPAASRAWQLRRARGLVEPKGGVIVAEYFDVDKSRSIPWARRPRASALVEALKSPARGFDAVVVGEPHRAFYGNQYSLTFPLFEHFGVPLWVPEVGGPIDPANEAHDMIMGVFGGLSKGSGTGSRSGSVRRWPRSPRPRAATWVGARRTGTSWSTPGRTPTPPKRPKASAFAVWSRIRRIHWW
ncbi:recombinase family protein [Actinomadura yumaensis]|uniref:recombinase family protein n=1 Tax=Actinomadura yumaensis TaxID=111807 RepID=UPI003622C4F1